MQAVVVAVAVPVEEVKFIQPKVFSSLDLLRSLRERAIGAFSLLEMDASNHLTCCQLDCSNGVFAAE